MPGGRCLLFTMLFTVTVTVYNAWWCLACVVLSAALVTRRPEGDGTSVRAKPPPNGLQHRKQPLLSPFLLCFARTVYF